MTEDDLDDRRWKIEKIEETKKTLLQMEMNDVDSRDRERFVDFLNSRLTNPR